MKTTKTYVLATAIALGLWGGASFAQDQGYTMMEQQVINDLNMLGINPAGVRMLTMAELATLSSILESMDTNAEKTAAAQKVMDDAMAQPERAAANEGALQLEATLMGDLGKLGLMLPEGQMLMPSQIARLTSIMNGTERDETKKAAAEVVLAETMPEVTPFGKSGYEQLEASLAGNFASIGVEQPAFGTLTLAQVSELNVIFNSMDTNDVKKAAVLKVIQG